MNKISTQLVGIELYFDDLHKAKTFYTETLGLKLADEQPGRHAKFESGAAFICLGEEGSGILPIEG